MREEPILGSTKVGSRGQIVIPMEIRKRCGIEEGDTMIVMARPAHGGWTVSLMKASDMTGFLDHMEDASSRIRTLISGAGENKTKK
ncbi:MAG: AbrB/MazE/SpoVT family DNA-binding domain-containing protein [Thermoplasmatota archaeon]